VKGMDGRGVWSRCGSCGQMSTGALAVLTLVIMLPGISGGGTIGPSNSCRLGCMAVGEGVAWSLVVCAVLLHVVSGIFVVLKSCEI
jgi:hypothetical protein